MKVCLATYQAVSMLKGGPRTQILETKRGLEQLGVEVSLFDQWKPFGIGDADLVHLFAANIGTFHLAREFAKVGLPAVVTPIFFTRHSTRLVRAITRFDPAIRRIAHGAWTDYGIIAEICNWASAVLPNTKDEASLFEHAFGIPTERIHVIPNGVEKRFMDGDPTLFSKKYGIDRFILNVGHIGPKRKNVLNLIRALEQIDHPAVIIGRLENNAYGRQCLEEARKNPHLLIIQDLPHNSPLLESAYSACDVFVLPSLFETPGIAALEAALAGAKVVITPHGGTRDYFGDNAVYVNPYSIENIREGIRKAMKMTNDETLREKLQREFLWETIAERTFHVYRTIIKR